MVNATAAVRRFERMLPGIMYANSLRDRDPERYRKHMRASQTSVGPENSKLIAEIVYDNENETVRVERPKAV